MKKIYSLFFICLCLTKISFAQAPNYAWGKSSSGSSAEDSRSVTTDASGNIIVTGFFQSATINFGTTTFNNAASGYYDFFMVKYDQNGNVLWAMTNGGSFSDQIYGCTTDADNNVIVAGSFSSSSLTFGTTVLTNSGQSDLFITKFDSAGNVLWAVSTPGANDERVTGCSADGSGNIIVTGFYSDSTITFGSTVLTNSGPSADVFTLKLDPGGNVVWAKSVGGFYDDYSRSCSANTNGEIVISGNYNSPSMNAGSSVLTNAGGSDAFIIRYDSNGNQLWANTAGGSSQDYSYSCSIDASGNAYASGNFANSITFGTTVFNTIGMADVFAVKYDINGNIVWARSAGGTNSESCNACTNDASGNLYLTGAFGSATIYFGNTGINTTGANDMFVAKYDSSGNFLWAKNTGGFGDDYAYGIDVDPSGRVVMSGVFNSPSVVIGSSTLFNSGGFDMLVVKFQAPVSGIDDVTENSHRAFLYPNPAQGYFIFSLDAVYKNTELTISDLTGKLIYTANYRDQKVVGVNTSGLKAGNYIVKIQTGDSWFTQKLVVVN